jgi:poly(A) polymerase
MRRSQASIPEDRLDVDAVKVVRRLQRHGHQTYLVGGCVRDLLLERTPKDFDVSTSATPQQIKRLFRNCRIIGRRFRLAHIIFGRKIIETSTFRAAPRNDPEATGEEAIIWRDNIWGTAEEDAHRRDFTINGLFYDPVAGRVIDYVDGLRDLQLSTVRTIGDPWVRLQEDPVRILRAIKFAARLEMQVGPRTRQAMVRHRGLIAKCSVARLLEEIYRLLGSGTARTAFRMMHETGVLPVLFPELSPLLGAPADPAARPPVEAIRYLHSSRRRGAEAAPRPQEEPQPQPDKRRNADDGDQPRPGPAEQDALLELVLESMNPEQRALAGQWLWAHLRGLDQLCRGRRDRPVSHALLLGAPLFCLGQQALDPQLDTQRALDLLEALLQTVTARLCVSRRDRQELRQLLFAQRRMVVRSKRTRPMALVQRKYFQDALALLQLASGATGRYADSVSHWTRLQKPSGRRRRKSRRRRSRRPPEQA